MCIFMSGDVACPSGLYVTKHVAYGGLADTRTCTGCGCGAPSGGTCKGALQPQTTAPCAANAVVTDVPLPAMCASVGQALSFTYQASVSGGQCVVQQGTPTGSASPTNPTTFCCLP
jgi:hypothetical protein